VNIPPIPFEGQAVLVVGQTLGFIALHILLPNSCFWQTDTFGVPIWGAAAHQVWSVWCGYIWSKPGAARFFGPLWNNSWTGKVLCNKLRVVLDDLVNGHYTYLNMLVCCM